MSASTATPTLDELQQLAHEIINEKKHPELKTITQAPSLREQMLDSIQRYLTRRLAETNNHVTPDILREMDTIYDTPGVPLSLAKMLGYEMYDLQVALGRTVERSCARCNGSFQVVEPRKIGGYSSVSERHCARCRRFLSEHGKLQRRSEILTAQQSIMLALDVDTTLRGSPDPLALRHYRAKLLAFLHYWQAGEGRKATPTFSYRPGPIGCMICGAEDIHPFVTHQAQIPQGSIFAQLMHQQQIDPLPRMAAKFGHQYEPLESFHQALWRLQPATYFDFFPEYPLLDRPLLVLCEQCGYTVEDTHQLCDVSDLDEPLEWFKNMRELW